MIYYIVSQDRPAAASDKQGLAFYLRGAGTGCKNFSRIRSCAGAVFFVYNSEVIKYEPQEVI